MTSRLAVDAAVNGGENWGEELAGSQLRVSVKSRWSAFAHGRLRIDGERALLWAEHKETVAAARVADAVIRAYPSVGWSSTSSSRQSCEASGRVDAPKRICSEFFRMLPDHDDPPACKLCDDGQKFKG
jgi:hypothetical protein